MKRRLTLWFKRGFNSTMGHRDEALRKAIKAAGTGNELASQLGITPQALSQWEKVPPLRVLEVEKATGIPRHELRPDIYPPATTEAA